MAKVFEQWTVLKHEPIVEHHAHFWTVRGIMPDPKIKRVMSLARLQDGRVVVHNAVALDEPEMKKIEAWGPPSFLVVPGGFHRQDAKIWKQRYPKITVLAPWGARKNVEAVLPMDGSYDDLPSDPNIRLAHFAGLKKQEGFLWVKGPNDVTLVVNDAICNMPKRGLFSLNGLFLGPTGKPSVPRVVRVMFMHDKGALKQQLVALSDEPALKRVIVAHGEWLEQPKVQLKAVAALL